MGVFAYTALDLRGKAQSGTLIADSAAEARDRLRAQGLKILAFKPAPNRSALTLAALFGGRRRNDQVSEVARYLSLLLRSGVPLTDSLDVVARQSQSKLVTVLKQVRDRVAGGASLADAMTQHPQWFDTLFVSAVRVGEITGQLDESLTELADYLRARQSLRGQLTSALTYPIILVFVSVLVVLFLMTFVVPQLLEVLTASGRPLPTSTVLLKSGSDLLLTYWWAFGLGSAAIIIGAVAAYRHPPIRRAVQRWRLRLPVVGPLVQRNLVAQFAQQLSVMLRTGVPFVDAARTLTGLTRDLVLREELEAISEAVESGSDIAPTMQDSQVFPPVVVQLVAVGQDSGALTEMLSELRDRYDTEVRLALTRLTAALEPALIVLLAMGVGFVVYACLMPILDATRAIA